MTSSARFSSHATVFILINREWEEKGSGTVVFEFDARSSTLILINDPKGKNEFRCRLKPRIRSKGPRAYVIRAESGSGDERMILAVRFDKEKESTEFREFVEKNRLSGVDDRGGDDRRHASGAGGGMAATAAMATGGGGGASGGGGAGGAAWKRPSMEYRTGGGGGAEMMGAAVGSYFWTCPSCLQMNDASSMSCIVCGAWRTMGAAPAGGGGVEIKRDGGATAMYTTAETGGRMPAMGIAGMGMAAMDPSGGGMAGMMDPSGVGGAVGGPAEERPDKGSATRIMHLLYEFIPLTQDNVQRHARYYPHEKRDIKSIIVDQIKWTITNVPLETYPRES